EAVLRSADGQTRAGTVARAAAARAATSERDPPCPSAVQEGDPLGQAPPRPATRPATRAREDSEGTRPARAATESRPRQGPPYPRPLPNRPLQDARQWPRIRRALT